MARRNRAVATAHRDLENPGTWRRYKKGLCDTCRAGCCTLIVEVTAKDLIRLELTDEWEVANCLRELIRRLKKERLIKRYNFKSGKFVLEQKKGGDCLFLDPNRRCSMYEKRPEVCRAHPTLMGPRIGFCPYSSKE